MNYQQHLIIFSELRTVNTCGDATAARWNLIRSLSDYHHNTTTTSNSRGEDHVAPHVLVASSLQAEMEAVISALQLPHTSLQALQPASHLTAAARLVSHLGWTQVKIVSAQLQSRLVMGPSSVVSQKLSKLVIHLGWTQVKIVSAQLQSKLVMRSPGLDPGKISLCSDSK
jgi:hypothetical protein